MASHSSDFALLSAAQMRAAERAAFASGLASFEAMQRAGYAVAAAITERWSDTHATDIHVLCGPGNNGGDGFIAAAALQRAGYRVTVHGWKAKSDYKGDAAEAAAGWPGDVRAPNPDHLATFGKSVVVVDALFGIGLDRPLEGEVAAAIEAVNRSAASVVAVDIASGVNADDGRVLGAAIDADLTVTFGWRKRGHLSQPGAARCGDVLVVDVGFSADDLAGVGASCWMNAPVLWSAAYPLPQPTKHKYDRGHAVIVGGGLMTGAARLAARGARRAGVGLLTLAVPPAVWGIYAADQPGAIVRPYSYAAGFASLAGGGRVSALLVGSGLEPGEETSELVRTAIALGKPLVLDGGALGQDLVASEGRPDLVLTPHEGEFGRMFPDLVARESKIERALAAAARSGCTVVLKGSDTVVAAPDGRATMSGGAPATLATAGSGDVLAGIVTGLLALRMPPFLAASMGVWLHGRAAEGFGPGLALGLIAEDLPERLPAALAAAFPGETAAGE
jgi:ADP-dependent NAD(P)H-hydrate dehydratase / NAD(P)H-hydrate epimerase